MTNPQLCMTNPQLCMTDPQLRMTNPQLYMTSPQLRMTNLYNTYFIPFCIVLHVNLFYANLSVLL